ncbi:TfuA-like protein [Streptomyces sp. NPDC002845]
MTTHVFVGPTLPAEDVLTAVPHAVVHRPVRHGDLLALDAGGGDTLVIIDGAFHRAAPVRHKEIIDVLARGARVIGAAGMGALRAAELWRYGMEGVGLVFDMYAQGRLSADDEIAVGQLLPSGDRHRVTVPLVDVRWTVSNAVSEDVLTGPDGDVLLDAARGLHYTERTWPAIVRATRRLRRESGRAAEAVREFAERHPELSGLGRRDALLALSRSSAPRDHDAASSLVPAWLVPRTMYLERWRGTFHPAVRGRHASSVSDLDVLRFQQLYAPDFPTRYRRFALTRIAEDRQDRTVSEDHGLVHAALRAAGERGITAAGLSPGAWAYWLTPGERRESSVERRLLKVLVRSFRSAPGAAPFHGVPAGLRDTDAAWESSADAVAAADRLNERMARTEAGRTPRHRHLPDSVVREHLMERWQAAEPASLEAVARDRGFVSLTEAEDAARRFVLLHRVRGRRRATAG